MSITSSDLQAGLESLKDNIFWQVNQKRLMGEFNRVQTILLSNANAEESQLRVCASLMSAFQTAISMPDRIIQEKKTDEELKANEYDG